MSSGSVKSNNKGFIRSESVFENNQKESYFGLSEAIISFSSFSNKNENTNAFSTTKNIPFTELDPELKQILRQEFINIPKNLKTG